MACSSVVRWRTDSKGRHWAQRGKEGAERRIQLRVRQEDQGPIPPADRRRLHPAPCMDHCVSSIVDRTRTDFPPNRKVTWSCLAQNLPGKGLTSPGTGAPLYNPCHDLKIKPGHNTEGTAEQASCPRPPGCQGPQHNTWQRPTSAASGRTGGRL